MNARELELDPASYAGFRRLLHRTTGIRLADNKQVLVASRLLRRVRQLGLSDFGSYLGLANADRDEQQHVVDLLTTHETHFFREPAHFECLHRRILPQLPRERPWRLWSAACSSGEEPYSLAMTLSHHAPTRAFEVIGSDISRRELQQAASGRYPLRQASELPAAYRRWYCQPDEADSGFRINATLRERVRFLQINLHGDLPEIGRFDVILLRNVLIYFEGEARRRIVEQAIARLQPGGWLLTGHSESLGELARDLHCVSPSVYRL